MKQIFFRLVRLIRKAVGTDKILSHVDNRSNELRARFESDQAEIRREIANAHASMIDREAAHYASIEQRIETATADNRAHIIESQRRKRLFISTGLYGTWIAAAIARQRTDFDDYLLITIDRQSETENTDWAYKAHPDWFSVETIRHENYYDVAPGQLESTFREIAFFEIYSSHHLMLDFVRSNFRTLRYKMYEEGVATRLTESESTPEMTGEVLYAVRPNVMLQRTRHLVQIPKEDILAILERNSESYRLSTIEGNNNVLFLMPGVVPNGSPRKDLHDSYVRIFEFLKNKGYEVFVARHPRVPDFPEGNRFGPAYVIEDSIPVIDLYIYRNRSNIAMIIGQYSTLLCDSQYLYGIPALQLTGKMDNDLQNRMKIMQDSIVPSVHDFIKDLPHLLH